MGAPDLRDEILDVSATAAIKVLDAVIRATAVYRCPRCEEERRDIEARWCPRGCMSPYEPMGTKMQRVSLTPVLEAEPMPEDDLAGWVVNTAHLLRRGLEALRQARADAAAVMLLGAFDHNHTADSDRGRAQFICPVCGNASGTCGCNSTRHDDMQPTIGERNDRDPFRG